MLPWKSKTRVVARKDMGVNEHERPSSTTPKHQLVCIKFDLFSCSYILLMNKQIYDEMVSYFYLCICSFKILVELKMYVSVVVFFYEKLILEWF